MNIAAAVRKEKEQHPESFCPVKGCLWRTTTRYGYKPCETHPIRTCVTCQGAIIFPAPCHWVYNHETDEREPHCAGCAQRSEAGVSRHCTGAAAVESPSREASTPAGRPTPLLAPVGLPDSRPHPADCDCPKCVMPY